VEAGGREEKPESNGDGDSDLDTTIGRETQMDDTTTSENAMLPFVSETTERKEANTDSVSAK
jgi:hypothetical protein